MFERFLNRAGYKLVPKADRLRSSWDPFLYQQSILAQRTVTTIFDVGCYRGHTIKKYNRLFPQATIFGFEPNQTSWSFVSDRYSENSQVEVFNLALAEKPGKSTFYTNKLEATSSLFPRPNKSRRYFPKEDRMLSAYKVDVSTIDEVASKHAIERIDILKLDIQGGELNALHGAKKMLESHAIDMIFTEVMFVPHYQDAPLYHEIATFLEGAGYSFVDFLATFHGTNGQLRYGDALFLSPSIRNEYLDSMGEEP